MGKIDSVMQLNKAFPSTEGKLISIQVEVIMFYRGMFNIPFRDNIFLIKEEWKEIGKFMNWKLDK